MKLIEMKKWNEMKQMMRAKTHGEEVNDLEKIKGMRIERNKSKKVERN